MSEKGFSLLETVIFIILASLVIPIFYLTTTPVIKDMMVPTSYIKARFVAERKMEELMAYTFGNPALDVTSVGYAAVPGYAGYDWRWAITYLDCNNPSPVDPLHPCVGYAGNALTAAVGVTKYKEIDVTVKTPEGKTYRAVSAVTARY